MLVNGRPGDGEGHLPCPPHRGPAPDPEGPEFVLASSGENQARPAFLEMSQLETQNGTFPQNRE